jgi:hypothetical protein
LPEDGHSRADLLSLEKEVYWHGSRRSQAAEDAEEEPKRLLERSTITLAGVPTQLVVYSYGYDHIWDESSGSAVILLRIAREVYFNYGGLIWNIVIESDEDRADVAEADFEHLLETFQILD